MNSENPYAAVDTHLSPDAYMPRPAELGWVRQVKIVSILQIVLAALEIAMGALLVGLGFFMGSVAATEATIDAEQQEMLSMVRLVYWGLGGGVLLTSLLRMVAGIYSIWYRGYWLNIVSLFAGLVTSFTCYCAPLSIGLCIYGLIVYFNPAVAYAFRLAGQGYNEQQIFNNFLQIAPNQANDLTIGQQE